MIVGGVADNTLSGAAWVWTRSGITWTQQGSKLLGTGNVGQSGFGSAVDISVDDNTAIIGGFRDGIVDAISGFYPGAAWIFKRTGGAWSQQGPKLFGSGAIGNVRQGISVAISASGDIALVGGYTDNINKGAAWAWRRINGVWSQQGEKFAGTGANGNAQQGWSIALSGLGSTAVIGGFADSIGAGAVSVFTTQTNKVQFDYDSDFGSDASVRRATDGKWYIKVSTGNDTTLQWGGATDRIAPADYDGDGKTDVAIFRPSEGNWYINNSQTSSMSVIQWGNSTDIPTPSAYR